MKITKGVITSINKITLRKYEFLFSRMRYKVTFYLRDTNASNKQNIWMKLKQQRGTIYARKGQEARP